jgi:hypothetical protein
MQGALPKKNDGPRRIFDWLLRNQPTPISFKTIFLVRFGTFLGKGSSKTPLKCYYKKPMSKKLPEKIDKNFNVKFSSICFLFYRVGCFLAMGVQKHYKKRFAKKSFRKEIAKKMTKNPKPFFSRFFYHVFGHDKKIEKKTDQPWYFLGLRGTNHHVLTKQPIWARRGLTPKRNPLHQAGVWGDYGLWQINTLGATSGRERERESSYMVQRTKTRGAAKKTKVT